MFLYPVIFHHPMAKKESGGFQSSAGLMRYFDVENDKAIKIGPKFVIGMAIAAIVGVLMLHIFYPM